MEDTGDRKFKHSCSEIPDKFKSISCRDLSGHLQDALKYAPFDGSYEDSYTAKLSAKFDSLCYLDNDSFSPGLPNLNKEVATLIRKLEKAFTQTRA